MTPKLSVIIPTYNGEKFIGRAIESVLNQTFKNFELIIVDDGSTDNTKEIVMEYQKKDERIKYLWEENSGGPAKPYNLALKQCGGEYIAFLDHDDMWLPEKLEKQIDFIEKEKIVGGNCLAFKYDLLKNKLLGICGAGFSGFIGKKILYKFIYPLDETLSGIEDGEFSIKIEIAKMNKKINENDFKLLEEPLLLYTRHSESLSFGRQNNLVFIERYTKLLQKYAFLENENNLTPTLKDILSNCWIKLGMHYLIIGERKMAKEAIDHSLKIKKSLLGKFFKYINFLPPKFYLYCRIFFSEFFVENIYYKYNLIKFKKYYLKYKKDLDILIKSAKSI